MKISNKHKFSKIKLLLLAIILGIVPFVNISQVNAEPITGRSIALSSSAGGATGVTYTLTTAALPTTGTAVKSVDISFCTTISGCSTPSGFSSSSSTLTGQPTGLGAASGWTVSTATSGSLRVLNDSNSTNPSGTVSITWAGVANPTAVNTTFYGKITTYSGSDWTGALDTGTVALSTSQQIQISLTVDETLTFCTGTSITGQNCGTIAGSTVNLGTGSTTSASSGTSIMAASTNASSGYSIAVTGATLTSGANTIDALATGGTSSPGAKQFGLNLVDNADPNVGAAVSGGGSGTAATNYNTADNFRFATGNTVASASASTDANAFTVAYMANISGNTPPGVYSTNLVFSATANF